MPVVISLLTNDDFGNDTGRVRAIQVEDAIDLEWEVVGRGPKYRIKDGFLHLSRATFPITGKRDWYGNWCWTAVSMGMEQACAFLNWLSKEERWHCEGGYCDLTDAWVEAKVTPDLLIGINGKTTVR